MMIVVMVVMMVVVMVVMMVVMVVVMVLGRRAGERTKYLYARLVHWPVKQMPQFGGCCFGTWDRQIVTPVLLLRVSKRYLLYSSGCGT